VRVELDKVQPNPVLLPERLIRERAAKEKRTFFRNAHSDRLDTFDGGDFAVGQVFCAEAARESAASKQTGDNVACWDKSGSEFPIHFSFDSRE
jgi:hypothetical protein